MFSVKSRNKRFRFLTKYLSSYFQTRLSNYSSLLYEYFVADRLHNYEASIYHYHPFLQCFLIINITILLYLKWNYNWIYRIQFLVLLSFVRNLYKIVETRNIKTQKYKYNIIISNRKSFKVKITRDVYLIYSVKTER